MVPGFSSCHWVQRHFSNDYAFVASALASIGIRHDRLFALVEDVADEDLFAALVVATSSVRHISLWPHHHSSFPAIG